MDFGDVVEAIIDVLALPFSRKKKEKDEQEGCGCLGFLFKVIFWFVVLGLIGFFVLGYFQVKTGLNT